MQTFCAHPPRWQLDSLYAPFVYSSSASTLVGRLKFHRQRWLGQVLGQLLQPWIASSHYDLCVPVPLHRRRLAKRGFNQALEIAQAMMPATRAMRLHSSLRRVRDTPAQSQLSAEARRGNLNGCFVVTDAVNQCRVLLVDDVVTTGSTLNAIATLLRNHGASYVGGIAFARTVPSYIANV